MLRWIFEKIRPEEPKEELKEESNNELAEIYFNRGMDYQKQHKFNEAITDYTQAININLV